jgi:hypothetical protein
MDARGGDAGGMLSSAGIGNLWSEGLLYVDGVLVADGDETTLQWSMLPVGHWACVHLQAARVFMDDVTVFARDAASGGASGHLKVRLSELGMWSRPLSAYEVAQHATSDSYDYIRDSGAGLLVRRRRSDLALCLATSCDVTGAASYLNARCGWSDAEAASLCGRCRRFSRWRRGMGRARTTH